MSYKECCECGMMAEIRFNDAIHGDGKYYCEECMMDNLGIEVEEVTSYIFRKNGDYLGSSEDYDHDEIILEVASDEKYDIEYGLFEDEGDEE